MRPPTIVAIALLFAPLAPPAVSEPDPGASDWLTFEGVATQGSRDASEQWYDAWHGGRDWVCTQSVEKAVLVLTILDGATADMVTLEDLDGPFEGAVATKTAPGIAYVENYDGCWHFSIVGASVATTARYRLDIYPMTSTIECLVLNC